MIRTLRIQPKLSRRSQESINVVHRPSPAQLSRNIKPSVKIPLSLFKGAPPRRPEAHARVVTGLRQHLVIG